MNFVLGGKGANLAEMSRIGLPVPGGFTITCQTCVAYSGAGNVWPESALDEIVAAEADLEARCGKKLGDANDPLLVSVRSGAPFSMPGMMDTVLNLGLNDDSVQGLIAQTQNPRFAWDSYRRFIQMFSNVVMGVDADLFENALTQARLVAGVRVDSELSAEDLQELVETFKGIFSENVEAALYPELEVADGKPVFPHDPELQLRLAIQAVFGSWMNERACIYRKQHGISDELGTAVNVQAIRARPPRPASPSRAIRPTAPRSFTATFWLTPRARTSSPASAIPSPSPTSRPPLASSLQVRSSSACS
jgi:pyruvate,orthophosphate dikinase